MLQRAPLHPVALPAARPPAPCSNAYSGGGAPRSRLSGKGVAELLQVAPGAYFEVPAGVLPEATHEYYQDPVLKVCRAYNNAEGGRPMGAGAGVQRCLAFWHGRSVA